MNGALLAGISAQFTQWDWLIVVAYLAFTTWLGARMAGRQATIRDFFLGGRKLPWYAVSGSIIATEISALTFISVPWVVCQPGGNFTYLQLGVIGSFLARVIVGYVLVPAYYKREIYSPYDYMGNQLGGHVRSMTTVLFTIGGMLGQSARVYLTAEVLNVVMHDQLSWLSNALGLNPLAWAIILISIVSVGWTLIGGITTVIWTDVILFLCFLIGAFVAFGTIAAKLDGGLGEIFSVGWAAKDAGPWGKFTFFDFSLHPTRLYTIWTAAIASTWGGLGAYGTDQLLAQRMFCCKNERDARWAIISSSISQVVTLTVMLVGVGLYAYYQAHPAVGEAKELIAENGDRTFPVFIVEVIPRGLKGFIIAGVFAAAISSLMGILTALSQTSMSAFYNPLRERYLRARGVEVSLSGNVEELAEAQDASTEDRRSVLVGRLMVLVWGVALSLMAYWASMVAEHYKSILDLGLSMASYVSGALLAGFALSFLPLKIDGRGFMYSGPLSAVCVFALVWHQPWTHMVCWAIAIVFLAVWIFQIINEAGLPGATPAGRAAGQTIILIAGLALLLWLNYYGYWEHQDAAGNVVSQSVAWPWQAPVGSTIAFFWGYLLARRKTETGAESE